MAKFFFFFFFIFAAFKVYFLPRTPPPPPVHTTSSCRTRVRAHEVQPYVGHTGRRQLRTDLLIGNRRERTTHTKVDLKRYDMHVIVLAQERALWTRQ
jgi:hypothetical protein